MGKATRPQLVKRIRELFSFDYSMVDIAESFGISPRTVSNIVNGRTRQGVPTGVDIPPLPPSPSEQEARQEARRKGLAQQLGGPQQSPRRGRR